MPIVSFKPGTEETKKALNSVPFLNSDEAYSDSAFATIGYDAFN